MRMKDFWVWLKDKNFEKKESDQPQIPNTQTLIPTRFKRGFIQKNRERIAEQGKKEQHRQHLPGAENKREINERESGSGRGLFPKLLGSAPWSLKRGE